MKLTSSQRDRAAGVLLATAAGDALGAPFEFGPPLPATTDIAMTGGGSLQWAPGEWTDDTSMAIAIAEVAATGADLRTTHQQDTIVARWAGWAPTAPDVGVQTRQVPARPNLDAATATAAARALHERTGRSGGNGSLMRTAPIALAYLDDPAGLVEAATELSALTHYDPEAGEACVVWCVAIRHAVLTGELNLRRGLSVLPAGRAAVWAERIDVAERSRPADFPHNGWVVEALQAAWSAISTTAVPADDPAAGTFRVQHLQLGLEAAVRGGRDTDTVAAIAGGLLGAAYGSSAVPARWRRVLHGWPGLLANDLIRLGLQITRGGQPGWPDVTMMDYTDCEDVDVLARDPFDDHLWLSGVGALHNPPPGVDAVVSLCRIGYDQTPPGVDPRNHLVVWLIDSTDPADNPNLSFVLHDTVSVLRELRTDGHTVLLHCVQAQTRTPLVAAFYAAADADRTPEVALAAIAGALPDVHIEQVRNLLAAARAAPAARRGT